MNNFISTQSLGEIVAIMPKASDIFREYHIDFCCGGHRPLIEAIKEQGLDENEILNKLEDAYEEMKQYSNVVDFRKLSSSELIDYIINTHHSFTKKILPEISELAATILKVHGINHKELFKFHKLVRNLETELEQHLIKEEEILFPMIREYDKNPSEELLDNIKGNINETEEEHDAAGNILKELRKLTEDYKVPENGCGTYSMAFTKMQELEADLFEHIHLENNILFHRLDITLNE